MNKILVIQTAFIGDVILATPVVEALHRQFPEAAIDFLLRKGNEGLLVGHPYIRRVIVWNKKEEKLKNQLRIIRALRKEHYDVAINLQRFLSTGIFTAFSGANVRIGFKKNPLSRFFTHQIDHEIGTGKHEVERNLELLKPITGNKEWEKRPVLYPSDKDFAAVEKFKTGRYVCMAPTSVWFTKQWPAEKWEELIETIASDTKVYLLGGPPDTQACESIASKFPTKVESLAGKLNFLESAALMKNAAMNYVNDSAPMHIASAMNAPTTAIFCSTVPNFGFGPLSDSSRVVEVTEPLPCRPCGLHGYKACPEGHFKCALNISIKQVNS